MQIYSPCRVHRQRGWRLFIDLLEYKHRFLELLPLLRAWIDKTLFAYRDQAIGVNQWEFPHLGKVFPARLLQQAKAVVVSGHIPFLPLSQMGFADFIGIEGMAKEMRGVTYKDTFFVCAPFQGHEVLFFHELVHVVQWERWGVDRFLWAYSVGLIRNGYRDSPLERMAYRLEKEFLCRTLPFNVVNLIQKECDAIWEEVTSLTGLSLIG